MHKDASHEAGARREGRGARGKGADGHPRLPRAARRVEARRPSRQEVRRRTLGPFKEAGDALYAAKSEVDANDNEEFAANLELKLALLTEAEPLLDRDRPSRREGSTLVDPEALG